MANHGPASRVFNSFLLVGLVRIADVRAGLESYVDGTLRTYDANLNVPGRTCRVWLFEVLALLQKPVGGGGGGDAVLKCGDLGALEKEIMEWGNAHAGAAHENVQPRPVNAFALCRL